MTNEQRQRLTQIFVEEGLDVGPTPLMVQMRIRSRITDMLQEDDPMTLVTVSEEPDDSLGITIHHPGVGYGLASKN